jgi:hypothetical protein
LSAQRSVDTAVNSITAIASQRTLVSGSDLTRQVAISTPGMSPRVPLG